MTQLRTDKKAHALRGTAAFIVAVFSAAVLLFTGCPNSHSNKPATPKYKLTFSVDGGGSLTAKIGETEIKSDSEIEQNKTVIFTATPNTDYVVDKWTIQGGSFEAGTGTNGNTTAKVKVTANTTVKVSFKLKQYAVTFSVEGGNGTLKATPEGGAETATSPISVEHGKTVTFTATAETDYKVEKWTVTPAEALKEGGSEGSITAKVKITGEATVKVSFKRDYKSVAFADLDNYLKTATPASDGIYYIEVTGLTAADLKGDADTGTASPLGKVLNDNPTKKVALKLPKTIEGLTDMSASFFDCRSLVSVKEIPQGVTAMRQCFQRCENLKEVPALPQGVQDIYHCFANCDNLTKVPALPESVKDMSYCFSRCANLKEVAALPNSVTNMENCFAQCTKLEKVAKLPANVKNMIQCFLQCESLKEVPELPQNLEDMTGCFKSCSSLTKSPEIPATVKNMEDCFSGCTSLVQAPTTIPEGVTNMNACFNACVKLENVPEIPATVEKMGFCFSECRALKGVVLKCEYKNGNYNFTFEHCEKLEDGGIKVPATYYDAYTAEDALNAMKVPGDDANAKKAKFAKIE